MMISLSICSRIGHHSAQLGIHKLKTRILLHSAQYHDDFYDHKNFDEAKPRQYFQ